MNEYSARYSILDREFYIPAESNLAAQSASNRQGRGEVLEGKAAAPQAASVREEEFVEAAAEGEEKAPRGRAPAKKAPAKKAEAAE